jgi:hypothetical protein
MKMSDILSEAVRQILLTEKRSKSRVRHIAVSEVPAETLKDVMEVGLLSGKVLLKHPDLLKKARPDAKKRAEWSREHRASLKKGEPTFKGPNAYIKPPPPTLRLSPKHPSRLHKLIRLEVDLDALMAEIPGTRIYGLELTPFPVTEDTWDRMSDKEKKEMGREIGNSRKRFLSTPELDELFSRSAEELWAHYDPKSSLYAGDVPHVAIVTPDGVVPPKFLRRLGKG